MSDRANTVSEILKCYQVSDYLESTLLSHTQVQGGNIFGHVIVIVMSTKIVMSVGDYRHLNDSISTTNRSNLVKTDFSEVQLQIKEHVHYSITKLPFFLATVATPINTTNSSIATVIRLSLKAKRKYNEDLYNTAFL